MRTLDRYHQPKRHLWWLPYLYLGMILSMLLGSLWQPVWAEDDTRTLLQRFSQSFTEIAQRASPAVVFIEVERPMDGPRGPHGFNHPFDSFEEEWRERFFQRRPEQRREFQPGGQGSGFLISPDGYILTNHHVVGEATRVRVSLQDRRTFDARLIGTDPKSDVAVIKIAGTNFPVLPLGNSDALQVGEWVIAIGNPFGLTHTVTVGIVSAKGRSRLGITDYEDFIQTDAAINPGNSGGPLLNLQGEVIGISTAIASRSGGFMGIGFAIPITMAQRIQAQLVATGKVVRGYLGVRTQDMTQELATSLHLISTEGALVAEVPQGTPAGQAGLRPGDVIVAVDGRAVQNAGQLRNLVAMMAPRTRVAVEVLRHGNHQSLGVVLAELPDNERVAGLPPAEWQHQLGVEVQDLTPDLAHRLGYDAEPGVLVARVEPGSPAAQAGLRRGMRILEVNHQPVSSRTEFLRTLDQMARTARLSLLVQYGQDTQVLTLRLS
jgi:serine protease Do